jgi:hypothetical protein
LLTILLLLLLRLAVGHATGLGATLRVGHATRLGTTLRVGHATRLGATLRVGHATWLLTVSHRFLLSVLLLLLWVPAHLRLLRISTSLRLLTVRCGVSTCRGTLLLLLWVSTHLRLLGIALGLTRLLRIALGLTGLLRIALGLTGLLRIALGLTGLLRVSTLRVHTWLLWWELLWLSNGATW